jgi:hypothetical protein
MPIIFLAVLGDADAVIVLPITVTSAIAATTAAIIAFFRFIFLIIVSSLIYHLCLDCFFFT